MDWRISFGSIFDLFWLKHFKELTTNLLKSQNVRKVTALYNNKQYQEAIDTVNKLLANPRINPISVPTLKSLRFYSEVEVDNQRLDGQINKIRDLFKANQIDDVLTNISEVLDTKEITQSTIWYLRFHKAQCFAKKNDFVSALEQMNKLFSETDFTVTVDDFLFKAQCEINLKQKNIARQTIKEGIINFPTNKRLLQSKANLY